MADVLGDELDLGSLVVPTAGGVVVVDDVWEPVRLLDASGFGGGRCSCVPAGLAGRGPVGGDPAVVCDGSAAVVSVRLGHRRGVGSGHSCRGPGLLPVAVVAGEAFPGIEFRRRGGSWPTERGDRSGRS